MQMTSSERVINFCFLFFVQVHDVIHFFPMSSEKEISFVWASQKSGFRHLYHVTSSLVSSPQANLPAAMAMDDEFVLGRKGCYSTLS
jgi:hypothetical protein